MNQPFKENINPTIRTPKSISIPFSIMKGTFFFSIIIVIKSNLVYYKILIIMNIKKINYKSKKNIMNKKTKKKLYTFQQKKKTLLLHLPRYHLQKSTACYTPLFTLLRKVAVCLGTPF